jgi:acyl-CoA synthetase (AMP-forming)/AMP-acid ligase II
LAEPVFPDFTPTVPAMLRAGRERWGAADCVVTPSGRLSYADLDRRSQRLAVRLVESGVAKCTRVGILFPNGVDWVVAWAAAARIGAVVIPVNTFYKPSELGRFLRHADVQVIVGVDSFLHHDYLDRLEVVAPGLASCPSFPLFLPELPQLRRVLLWKQSRVAWAQGGFGSGLEDDADATSPAMSVLGAMEADVTAGDPMLVTYTSGSTGEPKGVVHSHGALIRHARNLAALSLDDETTRLWSPLPLCWVGGFAFVLLRMLTVGACFITQDVFEPGTALRLLDAERATGISCGPEVTSALREHPDFPATDLSAIRSGPFWAVLPPDRRPPDPGLVINALGMSETCGPHTYRAPQEAFTGAPEEFRGTVGHDVPGLEHRIVDPDTGVDVAEGQEGEILVRGYSLMLGLYRRERTDTFDRDGWYHTGDRGYRRGEWLFFSGRQSTLIKTSGATVAPAEVERALMAQPGVKTAIVVGVDHPDRGKDVVAVVATSKDGVAFDAGQAREALRNELSSYKVPRHIFSIPDDEIPWLASNKVDRPAVEALAERLVHEERVGDGAVRA